MLLDLSGRLVVIVGGGAVAARKARGALEAGAKRVRVIAPQFDERMPAEVEKIATRFSPEQLEGAGLVFAATDDAAVNERVVHEARRRGVLVSRADAEEENSGDFATPALLRMGELLVTVSAGGSPALAAVVRDRIERGLDPRWGQLAAALRQLRPLIRQSGWPIERRRMVQRELAGEEALGIVERQGVEGLKRWIEERHGTMGAPMTKEQ